MDMGSQIGVHVMSAGVYGHVCVMVNGVCVLVGQFVLTSCWFASPQQPSWSLKYLVLGLSFDNKHDSNKGIMNSDLKIDYKGTAFFPCLFLLTQAFVE